MADYCLVEEPDLVALPKPLSYVDGASVACGFGTCYEGIRRVGVSGDDRVLVVGLGPMGLASLMIAKARGATTLIGAEVDGERIALTEKLGLADLVVRADKDALAKIKEATEGKGCEKTIDTSGHTLGRQLAIRATRQWGHVLFLGEGGTVEFNPSPDIIHNQITIHGSWVTSLGNMEDLVERMVRWGMHPEITCTHRFPLEKADEAFAVMNEGHCGKVAVVWDD
jgi:threonine dehydrogenase-like Zn-dependent dehydrogenase